MKKFQEIWEEVKKGIADPMPGYKEFAKKIYDEVHEKEAAMKLPEVRSIIQDNRTGLIGYYQKTEKDIHIVTTYKNDNGRHSSIRLNEWQYLIPKPKFMSELVEGMPFWVRNNEANPWVVRNYLKTRENNEYPFLTTEDTCWKYGITFGSNKVGKV